MSAFFRGNGANVVKIAPEHALKFMLNDRFKHIFSDATRKITPMERFYSGGASGAVAQVRRKLELDSHMPAEQARRQHGAGMERVGT